VCNSHPVNLFLFRFLKFAHYKGALLKLIQHKFSRYSLRRRIWSICDYTIQTCLLNSILIQQVTLFHGLTQLFLGEIVFLNYQQISCLSYTSYSFKTHKPIFIFSSLLNDSNRSRMRILYV
jgi:hypothetical protein